ncbi:LacI family transcriptional regulator [Bacillus sp. J14TS2]|uniref:LacI family DNA-binding transcriptional regulator n=1 Tax=Bacillus sp. J14TS2 TaxID=2807188 RepID=UPI001B280D1F|nr:LacI family DNA-binding transcriptional regulator [Bacillus sp. J14TS2]GIN69904.1 LacI family transcriptional regulator [Bacillus sp. J14TS2]
MHKVTIKDIARESGVSTATVSRVLSNRGYASEEIKEKVRSVADQLNYQPNAIARSLKMDRTNTIGIVIPDISNSYFMKISRGIEDTLAEIGYSLLFVSGDENSNKEQKVMKVLLEKRVDAIVLATSGENEEIIKKINHSGVPVILIDRKLESDELELDLIEEDNIEGAYQLTKYLIDQGHKKIGIVNGSLGVSTGRERYAGYKRALTEYNLELDENMVFNGSFTEEDGSNAVSHFLHKLEKPTAILSVNNTMTFGVLLQLTKMGYTIPNDMVVASYGEVEAAQLLRPSGIIYVKQQPYEMGVRTGEILIERLLNKRQIPTHKKFNPKLIIT